MTKIPFGLEFGYGEYSDMPDDFGRDWPHGTLQINRCTLTDGWCAYMELPILQKEKNVIFVKICNCASLAAEQPTS